MAENPFAKLEHNPDVRKNAEDRSDVPRDQYGRYLVPLPGMEHMASSRPVALTRVSTTTKALIQKKSLEEWRDGTIAIGLAKSPELIGAVNRAVEQGDLKEPRKIAGEAFKRGGGKTRSELGTAMHDFTERRNRGENLTLEDMPEEHRPSLAAYEELLTDRVRILPEYLERRVLCPWSNAGTLDNIVMYRNDLIQPDGFQVDDDPAPGEWDMRVADLKTGRDISKGWPEKLIQLWLYANAEWIWDEQLGAWVRMPREIRKDRGLIIHVPMNGTADLYDVDLSGMERVVEAAMIARRHNDEAKTKVRLVKSVDKRGPAYVSASTGQGPATQDAFALAPQPDGQTAQLERAIASATEQLAGQMPVATSQITAGTVEASHSLSNEQVSAVTAVHGVDVPAGALRGGTGKPLEPLAKDVGKRGCGVCGRVGHKRGSKVCLGENDPALTSGKTDATSHFEVDPNSQIPGVVAQTDGPGDGLLPPLASAPDVFSQLSQATPDAPTDVPGYVAGQTPDATSQLPHVDDVAPGYVAGQMPNGAPVATCPGHGAGWTNRGDGVFVCAQCGLPSAAVAKTLSEAVQAGQFPAYAQPHPSGPDVVPADAVVHGPMTPAGEAPQVDPKLSVPAATVTPNGWDDWVATDIRNAKTSQAVLNVRDLALSKGAWDEGKHDQIGRRRFEELKMEGK